MDASFATAPAPGRPNEDHVVVSGDFAIVLDGVSTPPGLATGCRHGTRWLVRTLGATLAGRLAARPHAPLAGVLGEAIERVRGSHGAGCDLAHPESPSTTVAMVRERGEVVDYLVLCDSSVGFESTRGCWAVTDDRTARLPAYDRATVASLRNSPAGFWVAAADPAAAQHALTGSVWRAGIHRVAVCSDGAARLVERFGHRWRDLFAIAGRSGPGGVIAAVRAAERAAQPAAERTAGRAGQRAAGPGSGRAKAFDDATVVICEFPAAAAAAMG